MRHHRPLHALLPALCAGLVWIASGNVQAGVTGKQGIEIEGPMDRRGFYIGAGARGGVTFFRSRDSAGFAGVDLALGGGITKNFTLGLDVQFMPYFTSPVGFAVGSDIEGTGYLVRGLFVRGALGMLALPKAVDDNGFAAGLGGRGGLGYEYFLNATAAMSISAEYDLRAIPGRGVNQGALIGVRFTWY